MLVVSWATLNTVLKEKPARPPSAVAEVPYEPLDFKKAFKALKENPNFLLLVLAFAIPFGAFMSIGALISNIYDPYDYAPQELAYMLILMLLTGVVGSIVVAVFVDKTGWYKYTMVFTTLTGCAATTMVIVGLTWWPANKGVMFGLWAVLGSTVVGYMPLCFSYGAELTFPLQPALINGTLTLLGSGAAGVFTVLGAFLVKEGADDDLLTPDELALVT